jgi:DNA-binding CsgD family transcriptional regulator
MEIHTLHDKNQLAQRKTHRRLDMGKITHSTHNLCEKNTYNLRLTPPKKQPNQLFMETISENGKPLDELLEKESARILAEIRRETDRLAALCALLDAAGWGVAFMDRIDGPIQIGTLSRNSLNEAGHTWDGTSPAWQDLCRMIATEQLVISSPRLLVWRTNNPTSPRNAITSRLTPREREVMAWIGKGKTAPELAIIFGCSLRTVEKHIENLYKKLGVRDRSALILNQTATHDTI